MEAVYPEALVKHLPPDQAQYFTEVLFRFFKPAMVWVQDLSDDAQRAGKADFVSLGWQTWEEFTRCEHQYKGFIYTWTFAYGMPYFQYGVH